VFQLLCCWIFLRVKVFTKLSSAISQSSKAICALCIYFNQLIIMDKPSTLIPFHRIHMEDSAECSPNHVRPPKKRENVHLDSLRGQQDRNVQAPYRNRYPTKRENCEIKDNADRSFPYTQLTTSMQCAQSCIVRFKKSNVT
jgi:hypothetical protein